MRKEKEKFKDSDLQFLEGTCLVPSASKERKEGGGGGIIKNVTRQEKSQE